MIVLRLRPRLAERERVEPLGRRRSETSKSEAWVAEHAAVVGRVLPDAEQEAVADGVQVGRVAADLELPAHHRARGRGEVEGVERVDLAEGDDVARVADEADGVHPLALPEAADAAERDERAAARSERRDDRLALAARPPHHVGRSVLATRRTPSRSESDHWFRSTPGTEPVPTVVGLGRARDVEAMDRGRRVRRRPRAVGTQVPPLGGDIEARRRGVDGAAVRDDRIRVDGVEAAVGVDRHHRDQPEAR